MNARVGFGVWSSNAGKRLLYWVGNPKMKTCVFRPDWLRQGGEVGHLVHWIKEPCSEIGLKHSNFGPEKMQMPWSHVPLSGALWQVMEPRTRAAYARRGRALGLAPASESSAPAPHCSAAAAKSSLTSNEHAAFVGLAAGEVKTLSRIYFPAAGCRRAFRTRLSIPRAA
jgi:hypothetical protein